MALLDVGGDLQWFVPDTMLLPLLVEWSQWHAGTFHAFPSLAVCPRLLHMFSNRQEVPCVIYAPHFRAGGQFSLQSLEWDRWGFRYVATFALTGPLSSGDGTPVAGVNECGGMLVPTEEGT